MNIRDIQLLYKIKEILGVGTIDIRERNQRKTCLYRIRNKSHLKSIVLPIFDKYPMFSNKQYDYLRFKENLLAGIIYSNELPIYQRPNIDFNTVNDILNTGYLRAGLVGGNLEACCVLRTRTANSYCELVLVLTRTRTANSNCVLC